MQIKKSELQAALEIVKPGLANKEIIEQTCSFAFLNDKVITYNDEISISHPVKGLEIQGAIQAQELYALLSKIKKEEIELEIKDNEILLKSGRAKAGIRIQSEIKLPLHEIGKIQEWKPLPEAFSRACRFVSSACGRDMSRPVLTCVHVNKEGFVEASDNCRISRFSLEESMPVDTFLIPATSILEVIKLPITKIAEGEGWIHFKTEEKTIVSCRVFSDKFPDTSSALKVEGEKIIFPTTLKDMLDKAMVFSKRDHSLDENVTILLNNKKITVKSQSDTGWFEEVEKLEEAINGELIFNITPYLLRDILNQQHICILSNRMMRFEGESWEYVTTLREKE